MTGLAALLDEIVGDIDALLLFTRDASTFDLFSDEETTMIVVAKDNAVGADNFVMLPLEFTNVNGRIRFGLEGAIRQELVAEGDEVVCLTTSFEENRIDTVVRVRADQFTQTGIYDLFTNSRADADVVRDVFEVAIELGRKGQKGKPVGDRKSVV